MAPPPPSLDKAVLITGAARRLGAEIARALHAAGCRVVLHCNRSRKEADALAADLNAARADSARVVQGDLLAYNALKGLIDHAASEYGRLDGLVNNASAFYATPVGQIDEDNWLDLIDSNLKAPLFLSQAAAPYLKKTGGSIVNLVDIHAERPLKDFVVYSVAKAGLAGLTRSLALELGPEVRVNGVAPGAILWPEAGHPGGGAFESKEQLRIVDQAPLKRVGAPADIAGAVKYLMLDAPYVTGQILAVDGGRTVAL
ncbi:MAG: pteridine reductase [Betaproteobacteria bacterium]|nr:pteridine reductase [Betaproteobacteria bacterium]